MDILSTKIEDLDYSTIEHEISSYYEMGYPDNSSFPVKLLEDTCKTFTLVCTKKSGDFHVRITKQSDGRYWLFVSPVGKIKSER